jgi:hypothetical protein
MAYVLAGTVGIVVGGIFGYATYVILAIKFGMRGF